MPGWLDKLTEKAKETLSDTEKMDRIKAKAQETLNDPQKRAAIQQKAEGVLGHFSHQGGTPMSPDPNIDSSIAGRSAAEETSESTPGSSAWADDSAGVRDGVEGETDE